MKVPPEALSVMAHWSHCEYWFRRDLQIGRPKPRVPRYSKLAHSRRAAMRPGERNTRIGRYDFSVFLFFFFVQGKKYLIYDVESSWLLIVRRPRPDPN